MAVWSYVPQGVLTDTLRTPGRTIQIAPQTFVSGTLVNSTPRYYDLQFQTVESIVANSMMGFFQDRRGAYEAFDWSYEGITTRVRFDTSMTMDMFQPGLLRTGGIRFVVVAS